MENRQTDLLTVLYKYIDLVLLVDCDRFERRHISQVGFLSRNQGENTCTVIYEDGEFLG